MLVFIIALGLALISPAAAQSPMPKTVKLHDNATGKPLGSVTQWGNKLTVRGVQGELIGTVVIAADGSRIFYDPDGKQIEMPALIDPTKPALLNKP